MYHVAEIPINSTFNIEHSNDPSVINELPVKMQ
jgi:hypothetical protein